MKKIILTGGGTAGHVTPNLALLPALREEDFEIHYIGSYNGIERIQDYELIVHPRCKNFLVEIYNYTWAKDRFGRTINKPIDDFNHLMDAMRYALESDTKHARILNRKEMGIY